MNRKNSWSNVIGMHFINAETGEYNFGLTNGMTAEMLLKKMHKPCDKTTAAGREIINHARVQLNIFCARVCLEGIETGMGYSAGAVGRNPTTYFIAQSKAEVRLILGNSAKNLAGRFGLFIARGQRIFELEDNKKLKRAVKLIESKIPKGPAISGSGGLLK
jgi:hypothetical protein